VVLAVLLAALVWASASSGDLDLSPGQIWALLSGRLPGRPEELNEAWAAVLWEVRLPRLATALLAGAALGLSGAVFQGLLLNPLADPYTLGVSSGAAFGAALVIVAGQLWPTLGWLTEPWALTGGAFAAAGLTLAAVLALARSEDGHLSPLNLILAGVMISAILSAAISFVKYLSGDQVGSIVFWLLGSFQARTWTDAGLVLAFFLPALLVALWSAVDLNIMTLGSRSAETLGVDTRRVRLRLLAAAALAASAAVAVAGIIGFVGLVVPHLVRLAAGPDHRALLPLSALGGALLLLAADTAVRVVIPSPGEIPVGVLTALLAGPVFLVIFRRHRRVLDRD
jgi:iron complex transport system permease protein